MTEKTWETVKICYCQRVDQQVALQAEVVYPAEWLPDQAPRVLAHRCSKGMECNLDQRAACLWAGSNPTFDPFLEVL